jgi:hypothetical protein
MHEMPELTKDQIVKAGLPPLYRLLRSRGPLATIPEVGRALGKDPRTIRRGLPLALHRIGSQDHYLKSDLWDWAVKFIQQREALDIGSP